MVRMATITQLEGLAADRLVADYELGIVGAREPTSGSSGALGWGYPQARLGAVRRYHQAVWMLGPLAPYVLAIVIGEPGQGDVSIAELARRLRQNRQAVGGIVKLGLQALAAHYGISDKRPRGLVDPHGYDPYTADHYGIDARNSRR
jgi:hypothetical protein